MDLPVILMNCVWAALFATGLAFLLTAPMRYLLPTFVCGFVARGVKDVGVGWGLDVNWATVIAAFVVVLVAAVFIRRHAVSPVVLVCGILPLGASVAMFNLIFTLMQLPSATGDALTQASIALSGNIGKVFTTSLAIALGLGAGVAVMRLLKRDEAVTV